METTQASKRPACPYKGLQPYTEEDRAYFFGRDREIRILIANLYAAPLTVFYGASGVGKSSVLLAGAVPEMRDVDRAPVVVFRNWQNTDFERVLKQAVLTEVSRATGKTAQADPSLRLDEFLAEASKGLRQPIFFILDQFEEYFLYTNSSTDEASFDAQLACAVNRRDIRANFLLVMREDGLSKLDRFQGRITNLFSNMLRLEHLDRAGAGDAIRKPLARYNESLAAGEPPVSIEDGLVEVLLDQVTTGKVLLSTQGQGQVAAGPREGAADTRIETPFLQLVLTRLWNEETAAGSRRLQLSTLTRLGGTEMIARTHLDSEMRQLSETEQGCAARMFRFLVTPSGTKIAQDPASLAAWAEVPESQARAVLQKLSSEMRILRAISAPGQPDRYEIFHDTLAPAILAWRQQREKDDVLRRQREEAAEAQERERARWYRRGFIGLTLLVLLLAFAVISNLYQNRQRMRVEGEYSNVKKKLDAADVQLKAAHELHDKVLQAGQLIRDGQSATVDRKYDLAIEKFDQAIQINSEDATPIMLKGYAQMRRGDHAAAVETFRQALRIDPKYGWAHYNLALAYGKVGNSQEAVREIRLAIECDPGNRERILKDGQFREIKKLPGFQDAIQGAADK